MKILMLIDSLGIGGAETHVETLALGLAELGSDVCVASSGGAIAQRLVAKGIPHLLLPSVVNTSPRLPLPLRLALAREMLARYIERERPDVVHAHTRRMAFLISGICRRRKIPLIFTAHAKFSMDFPKNIFSRWGDATIAVSEDIASHVIAHSGTHSFVNFLCRSGVKSITVIPNGVKTVKMGGEADEK